MHRIYIAATINYDLGSDDPEEMTHYKQNQKCYGLYEKKPGEKGVPLN